jgi:cysteine synthase
MLIPTPTYRAEENLFFKLEHVNFGGSHKVRAAKFMIEQAIRDGRLRPGSGQTIIEKTGGNLGIGLAIFANRYGFSLELAVASSFSPVKRKILDYYGAELIGIDMLKAGAKPREVIAYHLEMAEAWGKQYYFIDQFNNEANFRAHYEETAVELITHIESTFGAQYRDRLVLVGGVGSGASLSGIGLALKESFPDVEVVAVQPEGCDIANEKFIEHNLQGIAVGVKPKIFRADVVDRYVSCSEAAAYCAQRRFARQHGVFPGNSSGANVHVAYWIREQYASSKVQVISLIYDTGDAYVCSDCRMR